MSTGSGHQTLSTITANLSGILIVAEKLRVQHQLAKGLQSSFRLICLTLASICFGVVAVYTCQALHLAKQHDPLFNCPQRVPQALVDRLIDTSAKSVMSEKAWPVWQRKRTMGPSSICTSTPWQSGHVYFETLPSSMTPAFRPLPSIAMSVSTLRFSSQSRGLRHRSR